MNRTGSKGNQSMPGETVTCVAKDVCARDIDLRTNWTGDDDVDGPDLFDQVFGKEQVNTRQRETHVPNRSRLTNSD